MKSLEVKISIMDKENDHLKKTKSKLKKEIEKLRVSQYTSGTGGVIDKLRAKTLLLIQKLEVLVNEVANTEKTSEQTVVQLREWIDSKPDSVNGDITLKKMVSKFRELNFQSTPIKRDLALKHKKMDISLFDTIQTGYKKIIKTIELDIRSCKKDLAWKTKVLNFMMAEKRRDQEHSHNNTANHPNQRTPNQYKR